MTSSEKPRSIPSDPVKPPRAGDLVVALLFVFLGLVLPWFRGASALGIIVPFSIGVVLAAMAAQLPARARLPVFSRLPVFVGVLFGGAVVGSVIGVETGTWYLSWLSGVFVGGAAGVNLRYVRSRGSGPVGRPARSDPVLIGIYPREDVRPPATRNASGSVDLIVDGARVDSLELGDMRVMELGSPAGTEFELRLRASLDGAVSERTIRLRSTGDEADVITVTVVPGEGTSVAPQLDGAHAPFEFGATVMRAISAVS